MTGLSAQIAADILARVRQARPRVHCLMNTVVQKFTADGITVIGGLPSMTGSLEEVESFVARADALTVNLGTLDAERRAAIRLGVAVARAQGKPWIVDPVHCDYSPSRLAFAQELIALRPTVVRGNRAEMALIGETPGILRIVTGPVDRLQVGHSCVEIANGHPFMAQVTGTGCLSGGVIAAFLAAEPDALAAAGSALAVTGVAAELAASRAQGPGTFAPLFLDALAAVGEADILPLARIHHDQHDLIGRR
ncbi:hydroxyethylthiazole kinase [Rhizobium sp. Leaf341]|uniref:hydroxyethylthiazole kinase n=1 Tax=Rhizobium sp. Leaf341 TaxID=1736344 RepID=UPI00071489D1|nr:hydroxyethylthiazole kinase [Rhizobium sp. Leaf341]KQR69310.1 hydroxyethylthiazole kinase [Rhizobium sp. Leaf341]